MDDIYKAAVRDWAGWTHWGLTHLRMRGGGGQGHSRDVVGTQERTHILSAQGLKGMVGLVFWVLKGFRDWRGSVRVGRGGGHTL